MTLWNCYLPTNYERENSVTEPHEGCTRRHEDCRYPMSSSTTPFIHNKVSEHTTGEATNSEDGSDKGEGIIGHRNA